MRPNVRTLIPSILSLAALSSGIGCSAGTTMSSEVACPSEGDDRYKALSLSPNVDGVNFYEGTTTGSSPTPTRFRMTLGTICAKAKDAAACRVKVDTLAALTQNTGWNTEAFYGGSGAFDFAIATRGDEIELVASADDLARRVAPVDTASEALALVKLAYDPAAVCGEPNVTANATGFVVKTVHGDGRGIVSEILVSVTKGGALARGEAKQISSSSAPCAVGRKPATLVERTVAPWLDTLAAHFAEISHMEAAAVIAFENIETQLRHLGAPEHLLVRVRNARTDEVRHAEHTKALAERFGGVVQEPRCGAFDPTPSLREFALENAREGCVRETYGALVAGYQAMHAEDDEVRAALLTISGEELEHAALSWDIATWAETKLTREEQDEVARVRMDMIDDLRRSLADEPSKDIQRVAGMPDAATALRLLDALAPNLVPLTA